VVKFMSSRKELKPLIKQLKDGGFEVNNKDGWVTALDNDGTEVMVAMPHSNGSMMLKLNDDYFGSN